MVRARDREHLENLMERFPAETLDMTIHSSDQSDYPHRLFFAKSVWSEVLAALATELDYDNFKSEVGRAGYTHERYAACLAKTWGVMYGVTPRDHISDIFTESDTFPDWKREALSKPLSTRSELRATKPKTGDWYEQ
jgi:hypothetical protein